jgi:demethylmenaquinone methyltransferase/2-methoxy-6-polyprenyl-1,4-benzoquinol methylase
MTHLDGPERARYVREMFTRIARRYDRMNKLITFGQDRRWRAEVIRRAELPRGRSHLLDLGAGTGDLGFQALEENPAVVPIETDFTPAMMQVGRSRPGGEALHWAAADGLTLPFPAETFDASVSGFLLRNVTDIDRVLREQHRVLKPGGVVVSLDTTPPRKNLLTPLIRLHMGVIIPTLGRLLTGQAEAYAYLPESSVNFLPAEALAERMRAAGFRQVDFRRRMFGVVAIHWGVK